MSATIHQLAPDFVMSAIKQLGCETIEAFAQKKLYLDILSPWRSKSAIRGSRAPESEGNL